MMPPMVRGMKRAAARRADAEDVNRARMIKLNLATMPQRARAWALRCLRAGMKPAEVTRLTGVEIVTKKGDE